MSELWTAADIAKATGGKASADWSVSGVSIDSRSLEEGDLFVRLKMRAMDMNSYLWRKRMARVAC